MVDFNIEFCPHCGYELNYEACTCQECGSEIPEEAEYCPGCGTDLVYDFYECSRCRKEITQEEVDALHAMPAEEQAKHIHGLNVAFEEKEEQRESEREEHERQREIERKESRKIQAQKDKEEAELVRDVETLLAGKVDTVRSVKIQAAWIVTSFTKGGYAYTLSVLRENWNDDLLRLLDSIDMSPSDIESFKLECVKCWK